MYLGRQVALVVVVVVVVVVIRVGHRLVVCLVLRFVVDPLSQSGTLSVHAYGRTAISTGSLRAVLVTAALRTGLDRALADGQVLLGRSRQLDSVDNGVLGLGLCLDFLLVGPRRLLGALALRILLGSRFASGFGEAGWVQLAQLDVQLELCILRNTFKLLALSTSFSHIGFDDFEEFQSIAHSFRDARNVNLLLLLLKNYFNK